MRWLILAFLIVPALEIGVFIWVGGEIGPWWVVGLIILTGIVGVSLAKQQGLETWRRAQQSMNSGQVPAEEILDGICIFVGGVFLFTPGFITDVTGFILVLPGTRGMFKGLLQSSIKRLIDKDIVIYRKW